MDETEKMDETGNIKKFSEKSNERYKQAIKEYKQAIQSEMQGIADIWLINNENNPTGIEENCLWNTFCLNTDYTKERLSIFVDINKNCKCLYHKIKREEYIENKFISVCTGGPWFYISSSSLPIIPPGHSMLIIDRSIVCRGCFNLYIPNMSITHDYWCPMNSFTTIKPAK